MDPLLLVRPTLRRRGIHGHDVPRVEQRWSALRRGVFAVRTVPRGGHRAALQGLRLTVHIDDGSMHNAGISRRHDSAACSGGSQDHPEPAQRDSGSAVDLLDDVGGHHRTSAPDPVAHVSDGRVGREHRRPSAASADARRLDHRGPGGGDLAHKGQRRVVRRRGRLLSAGIGVAEGRIPSLAAASGRGRLRRHRAGATADTTFIDSRRRPQRLFRSRPAHRRLLGRWRTCAQLSPSSSSRGWVAPEDRTTAHPFRLQTSRLDSGSCRCSVQERLCSPARASAP